MQIKLIDNGHVQHADVFKRHVAYRIFTEYTDHGMHIEFCIDDSLGADESYMITSVNQGWKIVIIFCGGFGTNVSLFHFAVCRNFPIP